jgi:hypothetical protein
LIPDDEDNVDNSDELGSQFVLKERNDLLDEKQHKSNKLLEEKM